MSTRKSAGTKSPKGKAITLIAIPETANPETKTGYQQNNPTTPSQNHTYNKNSENKEKKHYKKNPHTCRRNAKYLTLLGAIKGDSASDRLLVGVNPTSLSLSSSRLVSRI